MKSRRWRRYVLVVKWHRARKMWQLEERPKPRSKTLHLMRFKAKAVAWARSECRRIWGLGRPSQLVVKGKNGRIQYENTYGRDPRRRPG